MRSSLTHHRYVLAGAIAATLVAVFPEGAAAGEYAVASCKADQLNYSTRAFEELATRGMSIRRACDPEGPGLRGLITRNVIRHGRVARRSFALVTISAPPVSTSIQLSPATPSARGRNSTPSGPTP